MKTQSLVDIAAASFVGSGVFALSVMVIGLACSGASNPLSGYAPAVAQTVVCEQVPDYTDEVVQILLKEKDPLARLRSEFDELKKSSAKDAVQTALCAAVGAREALAKIQNKKEELDGAVRSAKEAYGIAQEAVDALGL